MRGRTRSGRSRATRVSSARSARRRPARGRGPVRTARSTRADPNSQLYAFQRLRGEETRAGGVARLLDRALEGEDVGARRLREGADVGPVDFDQVPGRVAQIQLHPARRMAAERGAERLRVEDAELLRL